MSPALLVLGGGPFTVPALQWAREAGLGAVLCHPDPRPGERRMAEDVQRVPREDVEAHVALARRLAKRDRLAGVHAADPEAFPLLARLAEAAPGALPARGALERLLDPMATRARLAQRGLALATAADYGARALDVFAFVRDGAFVPCGTSERHALPYGGELALQPAELDAERTRAAYVLCERAARALEWTHGPLQVTLLERGGELALAKIHPGFADALGSTHVARLAFGKSPLQAWFAHLAGAGGPFDEPVRVARAAAGWLSVAPDRAGRFAGIDGVLRVRALAGIEGTWVEEPGRELGAPADETRALALVWAVGHDREELEERLRAARAALEVRVACRERVA
jgi:hypothetical protein